jgi:hypothetical protein
LLVVLLWVMAFVELRKERPTIRIGAAVGVTLLLIGSPLFVYTSGRAWNHDLPMLLTVAAFGLVVRRVDARGTPGVETTRLPAKTRSSGLQIAGVNVEPVVISAGILIGLAAATRLSFAFAFVAFVVALMVQPAAGWSIRRQRLLNFILGALLGGMPAIFFLLWSPQPFLFGNLT